MGNRASVTDTPAPAAAAVEEGSPGVGIGAGSGTGLEADTGSDSDIGDAVVRSGWRIAALDRDQRLRQNRAPALVQPEGRTIAQLGHS